MALLIDPYDKIVASEVLDEQQAKLLLLVLGQC